MVLHGENGDEMAESKMVNQIVFQYLTHPGERYGYVRGRLSNWMTLMADDVGSLTQDVQFPEDCIQVLRSRPFMFSARSCNRWAEGRVILCGDAAHVFPPC